MSLFTLFIHNTSLFRAFGFNLVPETIGGKVQTSIQSLLGRRDNALSVQVAYLPIVLGLELFQMVLHPLDSLVKFGINAAVRRMEYAADDFAAKQPRAPALPSKEKTTEGQEEYSSLLSKSLIKIHIQK